MGSVVSGVQGPEEGTFLLQLLGQSHLQYQPTSSVTVARILPKHE
jgi:hypothetical protein